MDVVIGFAALIALFVALYGWASHDALQARTRHRSVK
jgi:hypothetical protein